MNGYTISVVGSRNGLPARARVAACGRHVAGIAGRLTAPDYGDRRRDDRGGLRAVRKVGRVAVGPAEVDGPCVECGAAVDAVRRMVVGGVLDDE